MLWKFGGLKYIRGRGIATLFLPDRNCQLKEEKSANARGLGWAMLELTDHINENIEIFVAPSASRVCIQHLI